MITTIEFVREPLRSEIAEIADQENMSVVEFVEYVLRRYVEDFYTFDPDNAGEVEQESEMDENGSTGEDDSSDENSDN